MVQNADEAKSRRIRATLEGHTLWAFDKFRKITGKGESNALTWILDRWIELDQDFAERHGLTLEAYQGADVVPIHRDSGRGRGA